MRRFLMLVIAGFAMTAIADGERGENLIKNSDFNKPVSKPWSMVPGVVRKETAA